jgi:hypothetical protein
MIAFFRVSEFQRGWYKKDHWGTIPFLFAFRLENSSIVLENRG